MNNIVWLSAGAYCVFCVFCFYQKLHMKNFQGASQGFHTLLTVFVFLSMISGLGYLVIYGYKVDWIAAVIIFILGVAATIPGLLIERIIGLHAMSLAGFVVVPVAGYIMFSSIPTGT